MQALKRPLSICQHPGCGVLIARPGRCELHIPALLQSQREKRQARSAFYDSPKWRSLSRQCLARDPMCKWPGCHLPSKEADHIIPREDGGADTLENLQGLCHTHHSRKTMAERQGRA